MKRADNKQELSSRVITIALFFLQNRYTDRDALQVHTYLMIHLNDSPSNLKLWHPIAKL